MKIINKFLNLEKLSKLNRSTRDLLFKIINPLIKEKYSARNTSADKINYLCDWLFKNTDDGSYSNEKSDRLYKQTKSYTKDNEVIMTVNKEDYPLFTKFTLIDLKNNITNVTTSFDYKNFYGYNEITDPNKPCTIEINEEKNKIYGRNAVNEFCNNLMYLLPEKTKLDLANENYHLYHSAQNTCDYIKSATSDILNHKLNREIEINYNNTKANDIYLSTDAFGESYLKVFPAEVDGNIYDFNLKDSSFKENTLDNDIYL